MTSWYDSWAGTYRASSSEHGADVPNLEALHGGFAGERLDDESREYVFLARR